MPTSFGIQQGSPVSAAEQFSAPSNNEQQFIRRYKTVQHRIFPILKTVQFFLLTWLVSGSRFLQFYTTETMMYNTSIAMSMAFVLSGFLTHLHFSSLVGSATARFFSADAFFAYRQYVWLRVLVHLPIYLFSSFAVIIVSILLTEPSAAGLNSFSFKKLILSLSLTSSITSLYPLENSTKISDITLASSPTFVLASTFVICWLIYPLYARASYRLTAVRGLRLIYSVLVIVILPTAIAFFVATLPTDLKLAKNTEGVIEAYREMDTIWGAAVWYIHPCFKLPLFVVGIEAAEIVRHFGWSNQQSDEKTVVKTDASSTGAWPVDGRSQRIPERNVRDSGLVYSNSTGRSKVKRRIINFILGGLMDLAVYLFYCLLRHDVRKSVGKETLIVHRVGSHVWNSLGYSFLAKIANFGLTADLYEIWIRMAWASFMMPWSAILILLASPLGKYSLTVRLLTLQPILDVLPGRSGLIMSFMYPLIFASFSKSNQDGFEKGKGLAFLIVLLFVFTIPFYYYLYQPFQLWVIATVLSSPGMDCDRETDEEGAVPYVTDVPDDVSTSAPLSPSSLLVIKYLENSPSYDMICPEEPMKERDIFDKLIKDANAALTTPKGTTDENETRSCSGYLRWLYAVFIDIHFADNQRK